MDNKFYYWYLYAQLEYLDIGNFSVPRGWEIDSFNRGELTEELVLKKLKSEITSDDSEFMSYYSESHEVYWFQ